MNSGLPPVWWWTRSANRSNADRSAGRRRKRPKDVLRHGFRRQPGERDLAGQAPRAERLAKLRQRAVRIVPAGGSHRRDHEQLRGIHARSHVRDPVERRRVAPVEVLDRDDQRVVGGKRFDRDWSAPATSDPEPPRRAAAEARPPRVVQGRPGSWASHIGAYRSSVAIIRSRVRTPAQSHEGVEERLVRLAAAVLLDAVAPRHRDAVPLAQSGERFGQDGTLSHPGLAADQADLTGAASRSIEGIDHESDLGCRPTSVRRCREPAVPSACPAGTLRPSSGPRSGSHDDAASR